MSKDRLHKVLAVSVKAETTLTPNGEYQREVPIMAQDTETGRKEVVRTYKRFGFDESAPGKADGNEQFVADLLSEAKAEVVNAATVLLPVTLLARDGEGEKGIAAVVIDRDNAKVYSVSLGGNGILQKYFANIASVYSLTVGKARATGKVEAYLRRLAAPISLNDLATATKVAPAIVNAIAEAWVNAKDLEVKLDGLTAKVSLTESAKTRFAEESKASGKTPPTPTAKK